MTTRIYLDWNATTPPAREVVAAVADTLAEEYGNASSIHSFGQRAKAAVDGARTAVATLVGAEPGDVVFTSGGTEADNLAVRGVMDAVAGSARTRLIVSAVEHEAVLNTAKALAHRGVPVTILPVDANGLATVDALSAAIADDVALVSVMLANNETGVVEPVADLARVAHAHGALFHTDAVQAAGKIPVNVRSLGIDLLSLAAHKLGGPKGAGALWIRRGTKLLSPVTGGRQERNRRAGTEDVPALVGFGVAARLAHEHGRESARQMAALRDSLEAGILRDVPRTQVNGAGAARVPNTTNIAFDGIEAESLLIALDLDGLAVSTGSACSSGTLEPSHVLRAMGLPHRRVQSSIRFSVGPTTTADEIRRTLEIVPRVVERLRQIGRRDGAGRT
ncbi:MAG TPA: cysteine desulfurase family protein [Vicinamibacterales bacterium]|jgi:cysteine desulfurase